MKLTRLSHSAVQKYNGCSLCYKLHYIDGVRLKKLKSPLLFGSALDTGLNDLLLTKDLNSAKKMFVDKWEQPNPNDITYLKSDLDIEIYEHFHKNPGYVEYQEWWTLFYKGIMFIEAYNNEVLPRIKKVIAVQEPISIKNEEGDEITGFLDLIVEWEDGKIYLLDNKSSSYKYEEDSARKNDQLPLYYYATKNKYKLDGVGYIVLNKKINKNRIKTCKSCGLKNNSSHKTCPNIPVDLTRNIQFRCNGEFEVTINPTVDIQYVFNTVEESDVQRVIDLFDVANYNISNGIFATEHNPERGKFGWCDYKEYYDGSPDFIKVEKK